MPSLINKKTIISLLVLFLSLSLFQLAYTEIKTLTIISSSDDAEQTSGWFSSIKLSDSQIDLHSSGEWAGLRWTGINIPKGSIITNAYFEIYLPDTRDDYFTSKTVYCEKNGNPSTFTDITDDNISSRSKTNSSISLGTGGKNTGWKQSPSIVNLVQEVVDYSGIGDSLVVMIESTSSYDLDIRTWDYGSEYAAKLYLEYILPEPAPPVITNSIGASEIMPTSVRLNGEITVGYPEPNITLYWGDNDGGTDPENWDNVENIGTQYGSFYSDFSDLSRGTNYYYRFYAENSEGNDWADSTAEFKTPDYIITVTCFDANGNLSKCEVTYPQDSADTGPNDGICPESCSASGSSGSCSCSFTCDGVEEEFYNACGKATDTKGLTTEKCQTAAIECVAPPTNHDPVAAFECNPSNCVSYYSSDSDSGLVFKNNSFDPDGLEDIASCGWKILKGETSGDYDVDCSSTNLLCDYGVQAFALGYGEGSKEYRMRLKVTDNADVSDNSFSYFFVKKDIETDFMCSMDKEGPWEDCTDFKGIQKEYVYFKDISTVSNGAFEIISRTWELNGDTFSDENESTSSVELFERSNFIMLTVEDDQGRVDTASYNLGARLPLPTWKEIAP